jgi:hypothetical protein
MIFVGARWFWGNDLRRNRTLEHNHSSQGGKEIALVVRQSGGMHLQRPCLQGLYRAQGGGLVWHNPKVVAGTGRYRRNQHETWEDRRNQLRLYHGFFFNHHLQVRGYVLVQLHRDGELAHGL